MYNVIILFVFYEQLATIIKIEMLFYSY